MAGHPADTGGSAEPIKEEGFDQIRVLRVRETLQEKGGGPERPYGKVFQKGSVAGLQILFYTFTHARWVHDHVLREVQYAVPVRIQ